jgi:hypothetical protein
MNGLPANIDGREARWRQHHHLIHDEAAQRPEQRRFAGTGATRDEKVPLASFHEIDSRFVFWRRLDISGPTAGRSQRQRTARQRAT